MKEPMTTEEMDIVIAKYMGYVRYKQTRLYENYDSPICGQTAMLVDEMEFSCSWSHLMPVWQKLRGELDDLAVDEYGMVKDSDYIVSKYAIEKSILSCDITTAHRLMVEAIELIKK